MSSVHNRNPLISVIMPVYNRKAYLPEAVESILNQTYTHFELILADDGSTDGSRELIRQYAQNDHRVRAVFFPHRGVPKTFNAAVALSRGPLILRQDSDDIAHPNRLAGQYQWMQEEEVDICGCQAQIIGSNADALGWKSGITRLPVSHGLIVREMLFQITVWGGAMLMRREVCVHNPFSEQTNFTDSEWPLQMALKYTLGNVPQVLLKVRRHGTNTTERWSDDFGKEGTKARFQYFYRLFPKTSLSDYMAFVRLADGVPMTSLKELERAGHWVVKLARHPDEDLQKRMARRWRAACERSAGLGAEVDEIYRCFQEKLEQLRVEPCLKDTMEIPFNRPYTTGKELEYIAEANMAGMLAGDGSFTARCHTWLKNLSGAAGAFLTHSGTAALEMAALLIDLTPGDEVIMPSFAFPSTANAFVLRGAVPVFVDIREDTLNLDERLIETVITPRTKAICVVHYAGIGCEMDAIMEIADRHHLTVVEDAAHGVMASYHGRPLGSMGHFGAYSFHETKNLICGEGGALLINDQAFVERAEIIREKGTDRSRFFRGEIDEYCWRDMGSSFLLGELSAAFLWAQMEAADVILRDRMALWETYQEMLDGFEKENLLRRPVVPKGCRHNGHTYFVLMPDRATRDKLIFKLKEQNIHALSHYVPLHSAPAGLRFGKTHGKPTITADIAGRILRLPLWVGLQPGQVERVVITLESVLRSFKKRGWRGSAR